MPTESRDDIAHIPLTCAGMIAGAIEEMLQYILQTTDLSKSRVGDIVFDALLRHTRHRTVNEDFVVDLVKFLISGRGQDTFAWPESTSSKREFSGWLAHQLHIKPSFNGMKLKIQEISENTGMGYKQPPEPEKSVIINAAVELLPEAMGGGLLQNLQHSGVSVGNWLWCAYLIPVMCESLVPVETASKCQSAVLLKQWQVRLRNRVKGNRKINIREFVKTTTLGKALKDKAKSEDMITYAQKKSREHKGEDENSYKRKGALTWDLYQFTINTGKALEACLNCQGGPDCASKLILDGMTKDNLAQVRDVFARSEGLIKGLLEHAKTLGISKVKAFAKAQKDAMKDKLENTDHDQIMETVIDDVSSKVNQAAKGAVKKAQKYSDDPIKLFTSAKDLWKDFVNVLGQEYCAQPSHLVAGGGLLQITNNLRKSPLNLYDQELNRGYATIKRDVEILTGAAVVKLCSQIIKKVVEGIFPASKVVFGVISKVYQFLKLVWRTVQRMTVLYDYKKVKEKLEHNKLFEKDVNSKEFFEKSLLLKHSSLTKALICGLGLDGLYRIKNIECPYPSTVQEYWNSAAVLSVGRRPGAMKGMPAPLLLTPFGHSQYKKLSG